MTYPFLMYDIFKHFFAGIAPVGLNIDINNITGEFKILSPLDRENISEYTVTVTAFQVDNHLMSTNAQLKVIVDDVNDNRPDFIYPSSNIHINEDSPNGLLVLPLTVKDIDQGDNAKVNFVIKSDDLNAFGLKYDNLTSTTWLTVKNSPAIRGKDIAYIKLELREVTTVYGVPCDYLTTCTANLTVYIDDINDNTPVFSQSFYKFSVHNGNLSGDFVGKITANDADKGDNANITYSFSLVTSDLYCNQLMLNSVTGKFTLKSSMAMPKKICYLLATACDNPVDKFLQRCQAVSVTVETYSGAFLEYNVTEPENVPIRSPVTMLPINVDGLRINSTDFYVQQNILYTNINLDREKQDIYHVLFFNKDDLPVLRINIQVDDVNDNPPKFSQDIYDITLKYDIKIGQILIQVNATDADMKDNAKLKYSLLSGGEYFTIDENTGKIKLMNMPISTALIGIDYTILVTDMGIPPLRSAALLKVYVPNFNETLYVVIPMERNKLISDLEGVKKKLESILGVKIKILNIESVPDLASMGSRVYITATTSQGNQIDDLELNKLLKSNADKIYSTFHHADESQTSDVYFAPFIALLVISIVLLLIFLITLILLCRKQKKIQRQKQLFEKLNKDTTIYDSTRTHAGNGANASQSVANSDYENVDSHHTSVRTVFENPIFVPVTEEPNINNIQNDPHHSKEDNDVQKRSDEPENLEAESNKVTPLQDIKINSVENNSLENSPVDSRHQWHRRHSETDSGVPGIGENFDDENDANENDEEVAHILTHDQVDSFTSVNNNMSATAKTSPFFLSGIKQNSDSNIEEPEPDYAKKVHFSEESHNVPLNKSMDSEISNKDRADEEIHIPDSDIVDQFYFGATEITAL
ncbi:hypothetical protein Btru_001725 [Bulinus truncatus]|nr:hypothetical protein Btru_001725 [Bulinus truncatus]